MVNSKSHINFFVAAGACVAAMFVCVCLLVLLPIIPIVDHGSNLFRIGLPIFDRILCLLTAVFFFAGVCCTIIGLDHRRP